MEHYTKIYKNLPTLDYGVINTNKQISYINLPVGFDIETTSYKFGEVKTAFSYIWSFGIGHNEPVYYGRTWAEFNTMLQFIQLELNLTHKRRLVVYVHNLSYEFQFMSKYFTWAEDGIFSISERKPIKALTTGGVEFRDSYILSGFSLANTAKNLVKHKIEKLVGDLDYSLIRTQITPLSDIELKYCENDVKIITAYIDEQIDIYGDITKIPMTNTGRVRKFVKDSCYYTSKNHKKSKRSKYIKYRKIMEDLTIEPKNYPSLKRCFMGGFTHANAKYSNVVLENVSSVDFTSSYPSVMISEKFPMSRFKDIEIKSLDELYELCERFAVIFEIKLTGVTPIIDYENYISESKCETLIKPQLNNGRVFSAQELTTTITEIDFRIIRKCYQWDSIEVSNVQYAHKNYLPKPIIESILELYQSKTQLKDVAGYEVEYMLSKGMLNSIYGMCVTDVVKDIVEFDGDWSVTQADMNECVERYNKSKGRFLYYPWGIWVTAYARYNLWTGIHAIQDDYIYSDTDSIKLLNYENHSEYFKWFNNNIINKMLDMCEYYKIDTKLLNPKTKNGVEKMLGIWDFEGTYEKFKTLGAKRYVTYNKGKLNITVAGVSKQNGADYLMAISNGDSDLALQHFNDDLHIPAKATGKMTHTYIDNEYKFKVVDYLGDEAVVNPLSGIHLEPCDFTLSISDNYSQFIKNLAQGYLYKGVKHI